jgi:hypothetical protein
MLRLQAQLSTFTEGVVFKRGNRRHKARLGEIEASAKTEREAQDALALAVQTAIENMGRPLLMFDLVEPGKMWHAHQNSSGSWWYTIVRRAPVTILSGAMCEGGSCGSWKTRDEAIEHMRAHWYQCNIEPIVMGIVALCTGYRQWICKKCRYVQHGHEPYVCTAPGCGARR